jgi:hypothetical protein
MDKAKVAHAYAVAFVKKHPLATVNGFVALLIGAVVGKILSMIF